MAISNIRQTLENVDYDWKKPQTYMVFVPGLSLVLQKIQMAKVLPLPQHISKETALKHHKFTEICNAHFLGSATQFVLTILVTKTVAPPIFAYIAVASIFEMASSSLIPHLTQKVYEFNVGEDSSGYGTVKQKGRIYPPTNFNYVFPMFLFV